MTIEAKLIAAQPQAPHGIFVARTMEVVHAIHDYHKRSWRTKLAHLPKAAIIALAIAILALVSGATYAAYVLWQQPHTHTQQVGVDQNHAQVVIDTQNCAPLNGSSTFDIKNSSHIAPSDAAMITQASCEMQAVQTWANATWPSAPPQTLVNASPGLRIASIKGNSFTFTDDRDNNVTRTAAATTMFIANGQKTTRNAIKPGDAVLFVTKNSYGPQAGAPLSSQLLAIVKLDLPFKYYSTDFQNALVQSTPCAGNLNDDCVMAGGIDVYPRDNDHSTVHGSSIIEGRITAHNGATFTIKASSGDTFTVTAPHDVLSTFNTRYSPRYQGTTIQLGDLLWVQYQPGSDTHVITPESIANIQLIIDITDKQQKNVMKY